MHLNDKRLLTLVKNGLCKSEPPADLFDCAKDNDWEAIFKQASKQGVMGIAYDGLLHWIDKMNISQQLLLIWGANIDAMEKRYQKQYKALESLIKFYAENNIKVMVLKGVGLSLLYPNPMHREGGDIDIYLFNDFNKGNDLIEAAGIKVYKNKTINPKHSVFYWENTLVENHQWFLNRDTIFKKNQYIESILNEQAIVENCKKVFIGKQEAYLPSVAYNALYIMGHMSSHMLTSSIAIRHLCDWAVFLNKYYNEIDFKKLENDFAKTIFLKSYKVINTLVKNHINSAEAISIPCENEYAKIAKIILNKHILHPLDSQQKNKKNKANVLFLKLLKIKEKYIISKLLNNKLFAFKFILYIINKKILKTFRAFTSKK